MAIWWNVVLGGSRVGLQKWILCATTRSSTHYGPQRARATQYGVCMHWCPKTCKNLQNAAVAGAGGAKTTPAFALAGAQRLLSSSLGRQERQERQARSGGKSSHRDKQCAPHRAFLKVCRPSDTDTEARTDTRGPGGLLVIPGGRYRDHLHEDAAAVLGTALTPEPCIACRWSRWS